MDTHLSCCHVKDKLGYGREHRSGIYRYPYSYGSNNVPVEKELGISVFTRHTKDKKPVLSIEDERFLNIVQEFCQNEQKELGCSPTIHITHTMPTKQLWSSSLSSLLLVLHTGQKSWNERAEGTLFPREHTAALVHRYIYWALCIF